jgi:predicted small secreted protein
MKGSQVVLMTLGFRLRGLSLALAIFAVFDAGLVSACGTVAGAGQDGAGNIRAWLQY